MLNINFKTQVIFDEKRREEGNEIWIDCYQLARFLYKNRSDVEKVGDTKEWKRTYEMIDSEVEKYQKRE